MTGTEDNHDCSPDKKVPREYGVQMARHDDEHHGDSALELEQAPAPAPERDDGDVLSAKLTIIIINHFMRKKIFCVFI